MAAPEYSTKITVGGAWPGFDDRLAPWGLGRFISRAGGAVWNGTWGLANAHGAGILLIATWNDTEEGSDVESGFDGGLVDMNDGLSETLIRSTPVKVVWSGEPQSRKVQLYKDCAQLPYYDELHTSGVVLPLGPGEAHEIKVWVGNTYLAKVVKVRNPDPRCGPSSAAARWR